MSIIIQAATFSLFDSNSITIWKTVQENKYIVSFKRKKGLFFPPLETGFRSTLCSWEWPELLILLPFPKCWNYRHPSKVGSFVSGKQSQSFSLSWVRFWLLWSIGSTGSLIQTDIRTPGILDRDLGNLSKQLIFRKNKLALLLFSRVPPVFKQTWFAFSRAIILIIIPLIGSWNMYYIDF